MTQGPGKTEGGDWAVPGYEPVRILGEGAGDGSYWPGTPRPACPSRSSI